MYIYTCIYESHGHTIKVQSWCIYLHFNGSRDVGECCAIWTGTFYMSSYCRIILLFHVIYNLKNHLSESPDSSSVLSRYVLAIPSFLGHFLHPFPSWIWGPPTRRITDLAWSAALETPSTSTGAIFFKEPTCELFGEGTQEFWGVDLERNPKSPFAIFSWNLGNRKEQTTKKTVRLTSPNVCALVDHMPRQGWK